MQVGEEEIQRSIIQGLEAYGYTVLQTSRRVKRCRVCGQYPGAGDGVTKGLPDLIIGRHGFGGHPSGWGPLLLGLEVKGAKTAVRPEQRDLADRGLIAIVRSWEEARDEVASFERNMQLDGPLSRQCPDAGGTCRDMSRQNRTVSEPVERAS